MREADDAMAMRRFVQERGARRAVVAGAGLLGLEAAHALHELGLEVTVLDRGPGVLSRQSDERCSELLAGWFAALGITILSESTPAALELDAEGVAGVRLGDGSTVGTDLFVACAGISPNIDLAAAAGISCATGVLVDQRMRTNVDGVFAVGDVAEIDGRVDGLWPTAVAQAEVAANGLLGRESTFRPGDGAVILKGVGLDMTSLGERRERDGDDVIIIEGPGFEYRKLVVRDGIAVGAIVLGAGDDAGRATAAVKRRVDVSSLLDDLRTGDWSCLDRAT